MSISYYNQDEKAAGKEMGRHVYSIHFMTYRNALKWKRELEWSGRMGKDPYCRDFVLVRSISDVEEEDVNPW